MLEDLNDESFLGAEIAVLPPVNTGNETDADSGDEFVASGDPNNLNRNQLVAEACVQVWRPDGDVRLGLEEDSDYNESADENLPAEPLPEMKSKRKSQMPNISLKNTDCISNEDTEENLSDGPPAKKRSKRKSEPKPTTSSNSAENAEENLPIGPLPKGNCCCM